MGNAHRAASKQEFQQADNLSGRDAMYAGMAEPIKTETNDVLSMVEKVRHGWNRSALRIALCLMFLPILAIGQSPSLVQTAEPPPAQPVTIASIKARRAQMAELMKQYGEMAKADAADVVELKRQAKELGIDLQVPGVELGKRGPPGPPGKDGHSPVVDFGTGADADRLTIDGTVKGPHLTGPAGGPVIPPAPVDALEKAIADAYAATPAAEKPLVPLLVVVWKNEVENLDAEQTNEAVLLSLIAGRKAAQIGDGQLRGLRTVIDTELQKIFGKTVAPLTPELRANAKVQMAKIADLLSKLK